MSLPAQSAEAMATRCFCPPESDAGWRPLYSRSPRPARMRSISSFEIEALRPTSSATSSANSWRLTSCITMKLFLERSRAVLKAPANATEPSEGMMPHSDSAKVLLPHPLSPMTAITLCRGNAIRSTSRIRELPRLQVRSTASSAGYCSVGVPGVGTSTVWHPSGLSLFRLRKSVQRRPSSDSCISLSERISWDEKIFSIWPSLT